MQDSKPRRKSLVYGRTKRSTSIYDVFDLDDALANTTQSQSSSREDQGKLGQKQIHGQVVKSIEATPKGKLSNARQRLLSRQNPLYSDSLTQKKSASEDVAIQCSSPFDFQLSDEEDSTIVFEKSLQKRRRLTPVRNSGSAVKPHERGSTLSKSKDDSRKQSQEDRPATALHLKKRTIPRPGPVQRSSLRTRTPSPIAENSQAQAPLYTTPKHTRVLFNLLDSAGATNSPSKLPMKSLSLTNGDGLQSTFVESDLSSITQSISVQGRVPKPKRRLIDVMVSPRKRLSASESSLSSSQSSVLDAVESFSEVDDKKNETQSVAATSANAVSNMHKTAALVLGNPATSLATTTKARATYSRERSHLSDMVTEDVPDPIGRSMSQEDSMLLSQNSRMLVSFGSVILQEAEEDNEPEIAGIRSIHELRHSGGNARSQVDLESILEEIEAKGTSARARRIRGLIQLAEKLVDPEVSRYISDQSFDQRLRRFTHLEEGVVVQTLLTIVLSRLMTSTQLPINSLKWIFEILVLFGKSLLKEEKDIAVIARDRKQNLSKTTCKEINALVEPFCSSPVWPDARPKSLTPRLIFIRSLDIALRQIRQLGDFDLVLPIATFEQLVQLLLRTAPTQLVPTREADSMLVLEFTVSIVESVTISKHWNENGCLEIAKRLSGLGPILGQLPFASTESSDRVRHLILRLILNITNNDPDLCDAFSEPALLMAIFDFVKRDFLQAPTAANAVLEEPKSEGVILALGALSNLAEHSHIFRQAMSQQLLDNRSLVDWVACGFRDHVEKASEVSTLLSTHDLLAADIKLGFVH